MKNFLEIYYKWNYKYRLLYCLMLNYYRNHYANSKFQGKILVICSNKNELTEAYDQLYSTISSFTADDIEALKKFVDRNDEGLKQLFECLGKQNVYFDTIIEEIKREFVPKRALYKQCVYGDKETFTNEQNIVFMEFKDVNQLYEKHLVRELFVPEYFNVRKQNNSACNDLCNILTKYSREIIKTKNVLKSNNAIETEFLSLNVFVNSDDGLEFKDEVDRRLFAFGEE